MHRVGTATALIAMFLFTTPAHAYLDPGTGSLILQGILAGIAALVVTGRYWWHRVLVLLGLRKPLPEESEEEDDRE